MSGLITYYYEENTIDKATHDIISVLFDRNITLNGGNTFQRKWKGLPNSEIKREVYKMYTRLSFRNLLLEASREYHKKVR